MTLHEAIIKVLQQNGKTMSTQEIADTLNQNKWYTKGDGSAIAAFQIHGRTRKYPHLFNRAGSMVSLKSATGHSTNEVIVSKPEKHIKKLEQNANIPHELAVKVLMNEKNYKPAGSIQNFIPDEPGLYCIRIDDFHNLPEPFATYLTERQHNILYIGIATTSLRQRLGQELWAEGHGTFFRGFGSVLGYRPPAGSLINKKNKKNYIFSAADQASIIQWINAHLLINWVKFDGDFKNTEAMLIKEYLPLLNTTKNPAKLPELAALRKICREIANYH